MTAAVKPVDRGPHKFHRLTKSNGQKGQQMSKTIQLQSKVNSVIVRLHVAATWFELPFCPLVYVLRARRLLTLCVAIKFWPGGAFSRYSLWEAVVSLTSDMVVWVSIEWRPKVNTREEREVHPLYNSRSTVDCRGYRAMHGRGLVPGT